MSHPWLPTDCKKLIITPIGCQHASKLHLRFTYSVRPSFQPTSVLVLADRRHCSSSEAEEQLLRWDVLCNCAHASFRARVLS